MKRVLGIVFVSLLLIAGAAYAEVGTVQGTVVDSAGNPVMDAHAALQLDGVCVMKVYTALDGSYVFADVEAGIYNIKVGMKRLGNYLVEGVEVIANETTLVPTITLIPEGLGTGKNPDGVVADIGLDADSTLEKAAAADLTTLDSVKSLYR